MHRFPLSGAFKNTKEKPYVDDKYSSEEGRKKQSFRRVGDHKTPTAPRQRGTNQCIKYGEHMQSRYFCLLLRLRPLLVSGSQNWSSIIHFVFIGGGDGAGDHSGGFHLFPLIWTCHSGLVFTHIQRNRGIYNLLQAFGDMKR